MLLSHEVKVRARRQTGRRPGVDPRAATRAGLGIGDTLGETVMYPHSEKLRMPPPPFRHVRIESTDRRWGVVDVAIDEGSLDSPVGLSLGRSLNHYSSLLSVPSRQNLKPVKGPSVLHEYLSLQIWCQRNRQGTFGIVEVPVRIIGREKQDVV